MNMSGNEARQLYVDKANHWFVHIFAYTAMVSSGVVALNAAIGLFGVQQNRSIVWDMTKSTFSATGRCIISTVKKCIPTCANEEANEETEKDTPANPVPVPSSKKDDVAKEGHPTMQSLKEEIKASSTDIRNDQAAEPQLPKLSVTEL